MLKFSIITPTHDTKFLQETLNSVYEQTHKNWEVVLVPNGNADLTGLDIREGVKIYPYRSVSGCVGDIKRFAFSLGTGDVLVELDHDDLLAPTCLEELEKAYTQGADFVYSQFAEFRGDFKNPEPVAPFNHAHGWEYEKLPNGLNMHRQFDLFPSSLARIYYAPNHVRSFTKELYIKVGGHNPSLSVCDDQELMIRMYLEGAKFVEVKKCLYFYRFHEQNTVTLRNQQIQSKTQELHDKYFEKLGMEWAKRNGLKIIDLCGGFSKPTGYTSIDLENGDIKADLNVKWPLEDGSVGVLRAFDALEHLKDKQFVMAEIHRVLAHGGILLSHTPSALGQGAFMDPTHISYWVEGSFWYYTRQNQAQYINNTTQRFLEDTLCTSYPSEWHKTNHIPYVTANLIAIKKGSRVPGVLHI